MTGSAFLVLLKHLWTGLWIAVLTVLVIAVAASIILGYERFITAVLSILHQESHRSTAMQFVSRREFMWLQMLLVVWIGALTWLYYYLKKHTVATSFLQFVRQGITAVWESIISSHAGYVLLIPLASSLYYAITLPVTYDEAFTYVYFTKNSPLVSMSFYPAPNNHVLFSLITNFTQYLPFLPQLLTMRLPALVISLITWCLLFHMYKKWSGHKPALIFTAVVSMMFMSVYYSFMARGYAFVLLFFVTSCFAMWKIVKDNRSQHHWILFTLCSVFGLYTMPSYLYAWISGCVLMAVYARSGRLALLVSVGSAIILTFLLYLPIIITGGLDAVIHNRYVQSVPFHVFRSKADSFWYQAVGEMTGLHTILVLALLAAGVLYLIIQRRWRVINVFLIVVLTPVLILTYQSIIPFARTFAYLIPVLVVIMVIPYKSWIESVSNRIALSLAIVLQLGLWINFHRLIGPYDGVYRDYHQAAMFVLGDQQAYYFDSELFDTVLAFELETRGYRMRKATNFYPTIPHPMSADSITGYDYIIIDRDLDETKIKQPVFETNRLTIYQ